MSNISKTAKISDMVVIKNKDNFIIGDESEIREFTVITAKTKIGKNCGIERNVTISGSNQYFELGDYSSIAHGARIILQSNDYVNNLLSHESNIKGDVIFDKYSGVGANTVVMPNNHIPEGTVIGALSFVPADFKFEPWTVYAGIPIKKVKNRNKENILKQLKELEAKQ